MAQLNSGREVNPAEYYFRTAPRFESSVPSCAWPMQSIFIGWGQRLPSKVIFLFNPNYKVVGADVRLDTTIGLSAGSKFLLQEVYPREGTLIAKESSGIWSNGDTVHIDLPGTSATVFKLVPIETLPATPVVFNSANSRAKASLRGSILSLAHVSGQPGSDEDIGVLLPRDSRISAVSVNGRLTAFLQTGDYVSIPLRFAGQPFVQSQQVDLVARGDGRTLAGSFLIPQRVKSQLSARRVRWPICWSPEDYENTWLVPERLLLFAQIAEPSDGEQVQIKLDGELVNLSKAYSSVRVHSASFVGFYADISSIKPDVVHSLEINLSELARGSFQGVFFDNVEPEYTEAVRTRDTRVSSASPEGPIGAFRGQTLCCRTHDREFRDVLVQPASAVSSVRNEEAISLVPDAGTKLESVQCFSATQIGRMGIGFDYQREI